VTPERWGQIREIFDRALDSKDREAVLAEACKDDAELRGEVESLLKRCSDSRDQMFDHLAWRFAGVPTSASVGESVKTSAWIPRKLGKYQILGLLGEGGMGVVYRAEQERPRRIVAVKIIRPEWSSLELERRFDLESQALARLQHPSIAQIYEAGTAETVFGPNRTSPWSSLAASRFENTFTNIS
jgi:eukaryotic-like serine/threonine-protein kinase